MSLRATPYRALHVEQGGRLIDFGGWELPVQYAAGILAEHHAVRTAAGLFDVSHMGEIRARGPRALEACRHLLSNDLDIPVGKAQYSPMCTPEGGIVDDLIAYHLEGGEVLLCVNASNRAKDFAWVCANNPLPGEVEFIDEGDQWAQLALQGPRAAEILQACASVDLREMPYYGQAPATVAGVEGCLVARTGYTGEDGFEIFIRVEGAEAVYRRLQAVGAPLGMLPIGLGARDTLRLEARMCLYGNDIDETTSPLEAQIGWAVKLKKPDFIGRAALVAQRQAGVPRRLVGLLVSDRIPRPHCAVLHEGVVVGEVTSGTRSPTLGDNIALAYVPTALSQPGQALVVDVRGKPAAAVVVKGPFYTRPA